MQRFLLMLLVLIPSSVLAQSAIVGILGAGHPELHWSQIETEHFTIIFHDGLDSIAYRAAPMAEEVYRVVTANLKTPIKKKVKIYFSDNDEIKNAFAFDDNFIFIWMRGILDNMPYGLRSSGNSKWLRSVLTHEFTHTTVAHATKDWTDIFASVGSVPRWFNEGLARFMEPDGWTTDLDALLRVGVVTDRLDLGTYDEYLAGAFMYEGGHSLIRHIVATYGDSSISKILHYRDNLGRYNFMDAVKETTKKSIKDIYDEWHKRMIVYYATAYGQKQETADFARKLPVDLAVVFAARIAPDGKQIAVIGKRTKDSPPRLYLVANDTTSVAKLLLDEAGIEPSLSWYPNGRAICISKMRFGTNGNLLHDLYRVDVPSGSLTRLTDDGRFEEPDVVQSSGAQGTPLDMSTHVWPVTIVAVHTEQNHSDLVVLTDPPSTVKPVTHFNDPDVQVYAPRASNSGDKVTFSIFRKNGKRDIAIIDRTIPEEAVPEIVYTRDNIKGKVTYLTDDSLNNRSSVWSPSGDQVAYVSHRNGIPNIYRMKSEHGGENSQMTDVAGAIYCWDWSKEKDSILITSYDSRSQIALYWLSAKQAASSKPTPSLVDKYTAWRTVHFPLITKPADSLKPLAGLSIESYNSLAHISPLTLLPLITSDKGPTGEVGLRYGLTLVATDPMQKHFLSLFADYGVESKVFGEALVYVNRQLPQTISIMASNLYGYQGSIDRRPYYQKTQEGALNIIQIVTPPNSLTTFHVIAVGGKYRSLTPANLFELTNPLSPVETNHLPITYKGLELSLNYAFISEIFKFSINYTHADASLSSDLTYSRYDLGLSYHLPFNEDGDVYLGTRVNGAAQFGAQIPQEYLGFTTEEVFEQGFNLNALHKQSRLRGIRRPYYGDRMLLASEELVFGSPNGMSFATFFDIGSVWYDKTPSNFQQVVLTEIGKTQWLKTAGFELRFGIEGVFTIAGGVGWELVYGSKADWYFRINTGF